MGQTTALIIGKPIKIGNLLVAQNDFPVLMNWDDANAACIKLGGNWRLPTIHEMDIIYNNRFQLGGFNGINYWSSSKYFNTGPDIWVWGFLYGREFGNPINLTNSVRAISFYNGAKELIDSANIIGNPVRIGDIFVAQNDFPDAMNWDEAKNACAKLGYGWRLPTKEELEILKYNRSQIGILLGEYYWSSSVDEFDTSFVWGKVLTYSTSNEAVPKDELVYCRAVRSI